VIDFALPHGYRLVKLRPVAHTDLPVLEALDAMWAKIMEQVPGIPKAAFDLQPRGSQAILVGAALLLALPLTCYFVVELRGFEPLTPSMRTRCATGLRYSPWNVS
jgi:hypothetical protein